MIVESLKLLLNSGATASAGMDFPIFQRKENS